MRAAAEWLRDRLPTTSERLMETMLAALPEEADSVAAALGEAAEALYQDVLGGAGTREDALALLAADALLTHALQAQAELSPVGLEGFAARRGAAGRLGEIATARLHSGAPMTTDRSA